MDVDPLSDTVPPRYAVESDEEEDELNPLRPKPSPQDTSVNVKIAGDVPTGSTLAVATGDVAAFWAKGASLGEQVAAVFVNNVQIGLVFKPKWTQAIVIVSEALSRLPLFAMHPYAKTILDSLKPSRVSLLDTYPVPTYASDQPIPILDAPLRYLSTSDTVDIAGTDAQLFAPPNLIQTTSASFLAILSIGHPPVQGTLILLPSPHIPNPSPKEVSPSNFSHLAQDDVEWSAQQINLGQTLMFRSLGETVDHAWKPLETVQKEKTPKRTTEIGEGGMYI